MRLYLDCDVEVLKPFDDLLNKEYAICNEIVYDNKNGWFEQRIDAGVLLFRPCNKMVEHYSYHIDDIYSNLYVLPDLMGDALKENGYNIIFGLFLSGYEPKNDNNVYVLRAPYFSDKDNRVQEDVKYCVHRFTNSWTFDKNSIL